MKAITIIVLLGAIALVSAQNELVLETGEEEKTLTNYILTGSTCGGNCPSGSCTTCYCGSTKSMYNSATACSQYTGWS